MRILFRDDTCAVPSFGCVVADEIGFDADDGTLWFSYDNCTWSVECSEITANTFIHKAFCDGLVDLSCYLFHFDA